MPFTCDKRHTHATEFKRDRCNRRSGEWRQRRYFSNLNDRSIFTRDIPTYHISPTPATVTKIDTSQPIPVVRFAQPFKKRT